MMEDRTVAHCYRVAGASAGASKPERYVNLDYLLTDELIALLPRPKYMLVPVLKLELAPPQRYYVVRGPEFAWLCCARLVANAKYAEELQKGGTVELYTARDGEKAMRYLESGVPELEF